MKRILATAAMAAFAFAAGAHGQGCGYGPPPQPLPKADAYLHTIYDRYIGAHAKGVGMNEAAIRKYFEADLAAMIIKDDAQAEKNGDIPALEGDPFIDAQDFKVSGLTIKVDSEGGNRAAATVSFTNLGEHKVVHVQLVGAAGQWKIHDIVWNGDEGTLRGLYQH